MANNCLGESCRDRFTNSSREIEESDMNALLLRITVDSAICHGKPCVRGLRYPVEMILDLLGSGMTHDEILADYKDLEPDDLLAVLAYAARLARTKSLQSVVS